MKTSLPARLLLLPFLMAAVVSCGTLKVMTFNVRQSHARESDPFNSWDSRADACLEMLQRSKPDIVGFQEAYFKGQWSFFRDNLAQDCSGVAVGREDGVQKGETVGFLYRKGRLELLSSGTFWQSETPDIPSVCFNDGYERPVSWGRFMDLKTGAEFFYLNTHMALKGEAQKAGLEIVLNWLRENNPEGLPVVLTGDLNMTPVNSVFAPLRELMLDSREVAKKSDDSPTFNAWGNEKKASIIDYVWVTPDIRCSRYVVDRHAYSGHALISDHFPVYSILKIGK